MAERRGSRGAGDAPGEGDVTVSAIIVSYGTRALTLAAIRSVREKVELPHDVWVVDNASGDGSPGAIRERHPEVRLVALDENLGFGRANNVAMERASGSFFLLLNSDARLVRSGDVARLAAAFDEDPRLGVVGPRLQDDEGRLEYSARTFPTIGREVVTRFGLYRLLSPEARAGYLLGPWWDHGEAREVEWITGACMLVRREVWEEVGGFDPTIFMYGEEQEWCHRIRSAGWTIRYDPSVRVVHEGGASSRDEAGWRMRASLRGDLRLLRRTRGPAYLASFYLARLAGLLFEAAAFGLLSRIRRTDYHRSRARGAALGLREHLGLLRNGGNDG